METRTIDYVSASEHYRPERIKLLLVAEAPPPKGRSYFYVPRQLSLKKPLRLDQGLPATVFGHYFGRRPRTNEEYDLYLWTLCSMGIFLVDIYDRPIRVKGDPVGLRVIKDNIPSLRVRMADRRIAVPDEEIVFLLARPLYLQELKREFPHSRFVPWIDFRMSGACEPERV